VRGVPFIADRPPLWCGLTPGEEDPHAFSGLLATIHEPCAIAPAGNTMCASSSPPESDAGRGSAGFSRTSVDRRATTCDPEALLTQLADGAADVLVLDAGFHPVSGPLVTVERIRAAAPACAWSSSPTRRRGPERPPATATSTAWCSRAPMARSSSRR
jgi:hypothetical protein